MNKFKEWLNSIVGQYVEVDLVKIKFDELFVEKPQLKKSDIDLLNEVQTELNATFDKIFAEKQAPTINDETIEKLATCKLKNLHFGANWDIYSIGWIGICIEYPDLRSMENTKGKAEQKIILMVKQRIVLEIKDERSKNLLI